VKGDYIIIILVMVCAPAVAFAAFVVAQLLR